MKIQVFFIIKEIIHFFLYCLLWVEIFMYLAMGLTIIQLKWF